VTLVVRVVATLAALAVVVVALAWVFQRRLIYLPEGCPAAAAEQVLAGGSAVIVHTEDGLDLTAWYAPATGPATGVSVLVHRVLPLARPADRAGRGCVPLDRRVIPSRVDHQAGEVTQTRRPFSNTLLFRRQRPGVIDTVLEPPVELVVARVRVDGDAGFRAARVAHPAQLTPLPPPLLGIAVPGWLRTEITRSTVAVGHAQPGDDGVEVFA
jgi:hypothetical protein